MSKKYAGISAVVTLVLIAGAVFLAMSAFASPQILMSAGVVAFVGLAAQIVNQKFDRDLGNCGWLTPSIYVGYLMSSVQFPGNLPWTMSLGLAILVCLPSLAWRFVSGGSGALTFMAVNLLRVAISGAAYGGCLAALGNGLGHLAGFGAGSLTVYIFEYGVVNALMSGADDEEISKGWEHVRAEIGLLFPSLFASGWAAGGLAAFLMGVGVDWRLGLLAGSVAGALPSIGYNFGLFASSEEPALENQELIQKELNKVQYTNKTLLEKLDNNQDALKTKTSELELLHEMAKSLGASTKLSDTLQVLMSMIRKSQVPKNSIVIYLNTTNPATGQVGLQVAVADTQKQYQDILKVENILKLQEPVVTQVVQEQRAVLISEVVTSSEQRIFKDEKSVLGVPLIVSKENIGVIYLGCGAKGALKEEHLEKMKMLAAYAAPYIKTATLFEEKVQEVSEERSAREGVEAKNKQLFLLQKLGQAIGASLKMENALRVVADSLKEMLGDAQSVIIFVTSSGDQHSLKAEIAVSPYADFVKSLPVRIDEGIFGTAHQNKETQLIPDTHTCDLQNIINNERSVIVAPLFSESEPLGCIYVGAKQEYTFNDDHRNLVQTVSYQTAIALKNARLYEQTQQMALTDGLTGLWTHRYFQVRLQEELQWSDRSGKPICLVMVDTDKFKQYNDTLGHPAGDALLKDIAALLKDKVRQSDVVCRYGGDEFALILKDASKDLAAATCERIRETFQLRFATAAVQVTSSIGIACYPIDATDKKDLSEAADAALYVSKRTGRNRVTLSKTKAERQQEPHDDMPPLPR